MNKSDTLLALLRISLGFIFLWAFVDKVWGLGFATSPEKSWLMGVSPTTGFLRFGTDGVFSETFKMLAGNGLIDWLFMMGLLGVGLALILGIGMKIASYAGSLMMLLIYLASFPLENNPLVDDHIIYILLLLYLPTTSAANFWGLGKWWSQQSIVKKWPLLK